MGKSSGTLVPCTGRLIRRVASRRRVAVLCRRCHRALLVFVATYVLLLLASRLTALVPDWFGPLSVLVVPALAAVAAVAWPGRTTATDAARQVDVHAGTDDLFLTVALIDKAPGGFKPLVLDQAERVAPTIKPAHAVPYRWRPGAWQSAAALTLALAGALFLPQFDPFGKGEERERTAQRRRELEESRKATALRLALLKKTDPRAKVSPDVKKTVDELKKTFTEFKPTEQKKNRKRLTQVQNKLSKQWRERSEKRLRDAAQNTRSGPRVGAGKSQKSGEWKRTLSKGDPSAVKKELADMKEKLAKLQKSGDPAERQRLEQELKQQLKDLSDFLAANGTSKALDQSLKRALQQLAASQDPATAKAALDALKDTLDLSELDLEAVAQAMRDLQTLEQALEAAQLAKQLIQMKGLDGKACEGGGNIGDYAKLYKEMLGGMGGAGKGNMAGKGEDAGSNTVAEGGGMGRKGMGEGGEAPEDPDSKTAFKTERSRSHLRAGKHLLQWKTRGLSETGDVKESYQRELETVRQGVGEAILRERVPPGYHDTIKKYFDTLDETAEKP